MDTQRFASRILHLTVLALGFVYLVCVFSGFKPPYPANLIISALFIALLLVLRLWDNTAEKRKR